MGNRIRETKIAIILAATGQMTLTHYLSHLVLGIFLLSVITGKTLSFDLINDVPTSPEIILVFAVGYYLFSCAFSYMWTRKFKNGPLEMLMRKISD